jgi:hypothetical protein
MIPVTLFHIQDYPGTRYLRTSSTSSASNSRHIRYVTNSERTTVPSCVLCSTIMDYRDHTSLGRKSENLVYKLTARTGVYCRDKNLIDFWYILKFSKSSSLMNILTSYPSFILRFLLRISVAIWHTQLPLTQVINCHETRHEFHTIRCHLSLVIFRLTSRKIVEQRKDYSETCLPASVFLSFTQFAVIIYLISYLIKSDQTVMHRSKINICQTTLSFVHNAQLLFQF